MIEKSLIEHCAPTLGGLKTASLFTVKYDNEMFLHENVKELNDYISNKGVNIIILKQSTDIALIYVYRKNMLLRDFNNPLSQNILKKFGYFNLDIDKCLKILSARLHSYDEFPHEIGLFLGYPPKDVEGFICNKGKNCNLCGYWKVYGDTDEALQIFGRFDKCKAVYKKLWQEGSDIYRLTVKKQLVA